MEVVRTKDNKNETVSLRELKYGNVFEYGNNLYLYTRPVCDEYNNKCNCVTLEDGEIDALDYDTEVVKVNMKAVEE